MNASELDALLKLSCEERYEYFIALVSEERNLWILVNEHNEFLKIHAEEEGFEYLPVWPSEALALRYAGPSSGLKPKSLSLPEFFKKWVPGLSRDQIDMGILPGLDGTVWVNTAEEFKRDIQDEWAQM